MDDGQLASWMDGYVRAWRTNDPDDIGRLFTPGARYRTAPWREPWAGREGIIRGWLGRKDTQGQWSFRWEPVVSGDLAVVIGETTYHHEGRTYSNLWVMRFEGGRCSEFTEWWMEQR